uniref:Uncharacterized protein n=1 Tax=Sphaerodactylus townsendi TaxID=933632 RepID=A0ACB8G9M2_9SAUR
MPPFQTWALCSQTKGPGESQLMSVPPPAMAWPAPPALLRQCLIGSQHSPKVVGTFWFRCCRVEGHLTGGTLDFSTDGWGVPLTLVKGANTPEHPELLHGPFLTPPTHRIKL